MPETVTVTGIGCLCAAGDDLDEAVDSMLAGERRVGTAPLFTADHPQPYPVFAVRSHVPITADDVYLRTSQLGLKAAQQAFNQSGWDIEQLRTLRVGVCIGTTVGSTMDVESFYTDYQQALSPDMRPIRCFLDGNPATVISRHFGFNGPCQTIVNACSSGTDAIGMGSMWLQSGLCDVVLAGGADELCRTTYNGFASLQISAPVLSRPFGVDRCGLNLGEGAAVLVLESEQVRRQRQSAALGFIFGYGSGTDGWHLTAPHPEGRGLKQALNEVFDVSGVTVEQLAFINTHGTGTRDNDRVESLVLGEMLPTTPFHSTKGYTGHTLGAAGAIEAAFSLAFLRRRQIPASAGFTQQDPELPVTPVTQNTMVEGNMALSESLAFGGNNAALILGRGEFV
ncbi:MAG: beta-ketoacyl-[acyl-carrier-protein] synthase family protein [Thermodesulfobacteriota bacterium]|nr:beta-ketoacyl-[acyl-carrier-protein] synthase family protein [Thermodesulfobacteriota bacterium]